MTALSPVQVPEMLPTHKASVRAWKCERSVREVVRSPLPLQGLCILLPPARERLRVILPPSRSLLTRADPDSIQGCAWARGSLCALISSDRAQSWAQVTFVPQVLIWCSS